MRIVEDLTSKVFDRLTVLEKNSVTANYIGRYKCQCSCGSIIIVDASNLKTGHTKSCGCLRLETLTTHGHASKDTKSSEYITWQSMIQRCFNPNNDNYHHYGGRGITICEKWRNSFENFITDMGPKPSDNHSIDRINNDGNYEPGNCRWATRIEQMNNTRHNVFITFNDISKQIEDWAIITGINSNTIATRLRLGWSIEQALTESVERCKRNFNESNYVPVIIENIFYSSFG